MTENNIIPVPPTDMSETTISKSVWKLRRYGRLLPTDKKDNNNTSWKVHDSTKCDGHIDLSILESGHFLVSLAEDLLEGFSLVNAASFLRVQKKGDVLLFQANMKGESRIFRIQFDGASRTEAIAECERAVQRLEDYLPVGSQEKPAPQCSTSSTTQHPLQADQHFLGEGCLSLPLAYRSAGPLASVDLELLRLCLLDETFPGYVEEVEQELRRLCQEE